MFCLEPRLVEVKQQHPARTAVHKRHAEKGSKRLQRETDRGREGGREIARANERERPVHKRQVEKGQQRGTVREGFKADVARPEERVGPDLQLILCATDLEFSGGSRRHLELCNVPGWVSQDGVRDSSALREPLLRELGIDLGLESIPSPKHRYQRVSARGIGGSDLRKRERTSFSASTNE